MTETSQPRTRQEMVLIVEDDENSADLLRTFVEAQGYGAAVANSLADARQQLVLHHPSVVLLELHLPDGSGMDLFDDESLRGDCDIVLITGYASVETSVQALRLGAADYLIKPVSLKVLRNVFARLREADDADGRTADESIRETVTESRSTADARPVQRAVVPQEAAPHGEGRDAGRGARAATRRVADQPLIKGRSEPIAEVLRQIDKVARTSVSVFIVGESGTGKELVAQSVHRASRRRNGPFEAINCGAISAQLIESELFGHEKGSFTGAIRQHKGFFERASGGTLFLDEITEMSLDLQVKLLRVLETGTFSRVGSDALLSSDVRIIAATNRDPFKAIGDGKLREDLYYRLNVFQILLPPLRERLEDVADLAEHFMTVYNEKEARAPSFDPSAIAAMQRYDWPGNVRELRNFLHRTAILSDRDVITGAELPPFESGRGLLEPGARHQMEEASSATEDAGNAPGASGGRLYDVPPVADAGGARVVSVPVGTSIADMERALILATLEHCSGAKERTADLLGISLKTLYNRLRSYEE